MTTNNPEEIYNMSSIIKTCFEDTLNEYCNTDRLYINKKEIKILTI